MTPDKQKVARAIKDLRATLHQTQQEFSTKLDVAVRTVSRWEAERAPRGEVLLKLEGLAHNQNRPDLAKVFRAAYSTTGGSRTPMADVIRLFRASFGETQKEFAKRTGLAEVTIARYETHAQPAPDALELLADLARRTGRDSYAEIFAGNVSASDDLSHRRAAVLGVLLSAEVDAIKSRIAAGDGDALRRARFAFAVLHTAPSALLDELLSSMTPSLAKVDNLVDHRTLADEERERKIASLSIAAAFKGLRSQYLLALDDFARKLGIDPELLSAIEGGSVTPRRSICAKAGLFATERGNDSPELLAIFRRALRGDRVGLAPAWTLEGKTIRGLLANPDFEEDRDWSDAGLSDPSP